MTKSDGRDGYRVQYAGKQLLSTASKVEAESFITKYLREAGKIGHKEAAPLKAKFRKKAMKKSNISGITLRAGGFYEGTSLPIGRHATLESAEVQLRAAIKKKPASSVSSLGNPKSTRKAVSLLAILKRLRFLTNYGEPPAKRGRRTTTDMKRSHYTDDVMSSVKHSSSSKTVYDVEPATQPLCIQFKFPPVKDEFVSIGKQQLTKHPRLRMESLLQKEFHSDFSVREEARARWLRQVLVNLVECLQTKPFAAEYTQNCNRFRERESGPLCVLSDLLIITKRARLERHHAARSKVLHLKAGHDQDDEAYALVTSGEQVRKSLERLTTFVKAWDAVVKEVRYAPSKLSEYITSYFQILKILSSQDAFRLRGDYVAPWTARGYLLELIFQTGYVEVEIDREATLQQFLLANPDRHRHLQRLHKHFRLKYESRAPKTVKQFLRKALGGAACKCNALTVSMWLCFADDVGFRDADFDLSVRAWTSQAHEYVREFGIHPHPVIVAQRLR